MPSHRASREVAASEAEEYLPTKPNNKSMLSTSMRLLERHSPTSPFHLVLNRGARSKHPIGLVLKHSKQNTTPVHYKPSNPGESVLEPFIPELVCIFPHHQHPNHSSLWVWLTQRRREGSTFDDYLSSRSTFGNGINRWQPLCSVLNRGTCSIQMDPREVGSSESNPTTPQ